MAENKMARAGDGADRVSCKRSAADARNLTFVNIRDQKRGSVEALRLAYLRRAHGLTEAHANALVALVWGGWQ